MQERDNPNAIQRRKQALQRLCGSDDDKSESSDEEVESSDAQYGTDVTSDTDKRREEEDEITNQCGGMEDDAKVFEVTVPDQTKSLHLQRRVEIDGFVYSSRACSKTGTLYFYCTYSHPKCRAGFRYDPQTQMCIPNSKRHHHPPQHALQDEWKKNVQLYALRLFVDKHYYEDSRHIYTKILEEIQKNPEKYPPAKTISIKAIQNLKVLLAGENGRQLLNPTLPPVLREVDGVEFLAFQSVRPILLMFATESSLGKISTAQMLFLQRMHVQGSSLQYVYCVYAVNFSTAVPCLWLAFQVNNWFPWNTLQRKINEVQKDPRTWVLPMKLACLKEFSSALLRSCDKVMGIKGVYTRKINKLIASVSDKQFRKSLAEKLIELETISILEIDAATERIKQEVSEGCPSAMPVMLAWEARFSRTTLLWHEKNCCATDEVVAIYEAEKRRPYQALKDDRRVIKYIHEQYIHVEEVNKTHAS